MQEHRVIVPRTARYYTVGTPSAGVDDVWFVCHGYGQLAAAFLEPFHVLEDPRRLIVAPEGLSRYYTNHAAREVGASWMTREDRLTEIGDYVRYLDVLADHVLGGLDRDAIRCRALGFSQGVATVCRWIAHGTTRADQVILWAGGVPPDLDLAAHGERLATDLVLVIGEQDEYAGPAAIARERTRLHERGVSHRLITFAGGHRLSRDVLRQLASVTGVSA